MTTLISLDARRRSPRSTINVVSRVCLHPAFPGNDAGFPNQPFVADFVRLNLRPVSMVRAGSPNVAFVSGFRHHAATAADDQRTNPLRGRVAWGDVA